MPLLSASKPARDAPYVWPRQKWDQVSSLKFTAMRDGEAWYLISHTWYERWKAACNPASRSQGRETDEQLGPVDNSDIVGASGELIPGLSDGNQVHFVSPRTMELFTEWYGPPKYPIARRVISEGSYSTKRIEIYPYEIKTYRMSKINPHLPSSEPTHTIRISKAAPVSELLARVSEIWGNITPARFWHIQVNFLEQDPVDSIFYSSSRIENDLTQPFATTEEDKKKRLDEAEIEDGDAIIMETKHGEEWTIDLQATTLGQRIYRPKARVPLFTEEQMAKYRSHRAINQPKAQEPKAAAFTEEQVAKYRYHRADMESAQSEVYPPQDGDTIIQASDNVLFGVHRLLLKLASPTMIDMLSIGEKGASQNPVTIAENSKTFRDLLSFIYPDKRPTVFSNLDPAIQVLDAAAKYAMNGVTGAISTQITARMGTAGDELLYQDPLRVYIKARRLGLNELADAAAKATLSININQVHDDTPELADMPASWLWTLTKLRDAQSQWWAEKCNDLIQVAEMHDDYTHSRSPHPYFGHVPCGCRQVTETRSVPNRLQQKIVTYPCVRAVRKIDFAKELACLRCGAATAAHFKKISDEHERIHGRW